MAVSSQSNEGIAPEFADSQLYNDGLDLALFDHDVAFTSVMPNMTGWTDDSFLSVAPSGQQPFQLSAGISLTMVEPGLGSFSREIDDPLLNVEPKAPSFDQPSATSSIPNQDGELTSSASAEVKDEIPQRRKRGRKPHIKTEEQKEHQLHRQRQRNRLAAGRCRSKKKDETTDLVQNAERLKERRDSLQYTLDGLSSEVLDLKEAVMKHRFCGAGEVDTYLQRQFKSLVGTSDEESPKSSGPSNYTGVHLNSTSLESCDDILSLSSTRSPSPPSITFEV